MNRKELLNELNPEMGRKQSSGPDPFDDLALKGLRQAKTKSDIIDAGRRLNQKLDRRYGGTSRLRSIRPFLAIAASLLILLVCWGVFYIGDQVNDAEMAYHLDPHLPLATTALGVERDVASPSADLLSKGLGAYEQSDFSKAAAYLATYVEQQPQQHAAQLFLGHALLEGQAETAIPVLQTCMENPALDQNYRDYAQWFLAWAYLKADQQNLARPLLSVLAAGESVCAGDAQQLLKQQFSGE